MRKIEEKGLHATKYIDIHTTKLFTMTLHEEDVAASYLVIKVPFSLILLVCMTLAANGDLLAQLPATTPVGVVPVTIQPSPNGTSHAITPISAPLYTPAEIAGADVGRITGVAANTISNATAGWLAGSLAQTGFPHFVRIKSGNAAGHVFQISANSQTDLTVVPHGVDLTTLGIQVGSEGDTYEIVKGETLRGLLGTPEDGVVGGTLAAFNAQQTDRVLVNDPAGTMQSFYYDTTAGYWKGVESGVNENFLPLAPTAGIFYYRIARSPRQLTFVGAVPDTALRQILAADGSAIVSTYFPLDTNLSALGLQSLPGWRKLGDGGVTLQTTDRVVFKHSTGAIFSAYFDNATSTWKRVGSGASLNAQGIPAGSAVMLTRFGTGSPQVWERAMPYNLAEQ